MTEVTFNEIDLEKENHLSLNFIMLKGLYVNEHDKPVDEIGSKIIKQSLVPKGLNFAIRLMIDDVIMGD